MRKSLLTAGAACALLSGGFAATPAGAAGNGAGPVAGHTPGTTLSVAGTITSASASAAGEVLTVKTERPLAWTITVPSTATVSIRNGLAWQASSLYTGDRVVVNGSVTGQRALLASAVRDTSLVRTGFTGIVRWVSASTAPAQLTLQVGHRSDDGFVAGGLRVNVNVLATTPITLANGTAGTVASLTAGRLAHVAGIYDMPGRSLVLPSFVRILPARVPVNCDRDDRPACLTTKHTLTGRLVLEPSVTAPTLLQVRLNSGVTITVSVSANSSVVRRFNGSSDLSQLSVGDTLVLNGAFQTGSTTVFNAVRIQDVSVQEAYTTAHIRIATYTPSSMSGTATVLRHLPHTPYFNGEKIAVQFLSTTMVVRADGTAGSAADLNGIHLNERMWVSGRYDRSSHVLTVLRVHL